MVTDGVTDYRGVLIPDTNLFTVTWWIYFAFVVIATLVAIVVLIGTAVYLIKGDGFAVFFCTLPILLLLFGVLMTLRWFALMWKSVGCMITLLVTSVIAIILQACMLRFVTAENAGPEPMTLPHVILLIVSDIVEIILLSILIHEIRMMRES